MDRPLLRMTGIVKTFPGVRALDGVSFDVRRGEVHALIGENGAGKSTLMKILAGAYRADAGSIEIDGAPAAIDGPRAAERAGIGMIYQEFNLVPDLRVVDNLLLGHEPIRGPFLNSATAASQATSVLAELGLSIGLQRRARTLTVAEQQLVEVAKALLRDARLIVMDEPTAALTKREIDALFALIARLKTRGVAFVYISHRLEELAVVGDRITVLRDGKTIATKSIAEMPQDEMIRLMVGRPLDAHFPDVPAVATSAPVVLDVRHLRAASGVTVDDVSFLVRAGEIVGLAGLVGAGRTDIARAIAGADPRTGEVVIHGTAIHGGSPRAAIDAGLAFVTEDRKGQGLVLGMTIRENTTLAHLAAYERYGLLVRAEEVRVTAREIAELRIRTPSGEALARNLSGGNQQKVVLAKWLIAQARVFIFDEPTRGIDVGAKAEIYALMTTLLARGAGIVMISSELPEVLGLSHRILVIRGGRIAAEFTRADATPDRVIAAATGIAA